MKFSKYFMFAGFAALMASCASDAPVLNENPNAIPQEIAENDAYANFAIGLPNDGSTRAATAEKTSIDAEWMVGNGYILIFEKPDGVTSEDDYTFVDKFSITANWENNEAKDIDRSAYVPVAFPKGTFKTGSTYYALAVLNAPSAYNFPKTKDENGTGATAGEKFGDWSKTASNTTFTYSANGRTYITMVSAPKYTASERNTLVEIDKSELKTSVSLLDPNSVAATLYVHRVPAKISVDANNSSSNTFNITNGSYAGGKVVFSDWAVYNIAKTCYRTQNVRDLDFTNSWMHSYGTDFASFDRCTWAISPNYDTDLTGAALTNAFENKENLGLTNVLYLKENTMNFDKQIRNRTTTVVFKAKFQAPDIAANTTLVKMGSYQNLLYTKDDALALITTKVRNLWKSTAVVTLKEESYASGTYSLIEFVDIQASASDNSQPSTTDLDKIAAELNLVDRNNKDIRLYKNGTCYYQVRVRHFDDSEGDAIKLGSDFWTVAIPAYNAGHLGRYGIVRNNWYHINVSAVANIGTPTPPQPSTEIDDENNEVDALDFTINILNWAKRTQNATF